MLITVFTSTYNRARLLHRLYNSLKQQSFKDFEWLIVDDGSLDNTKEIINTFIAEGILDIKYVYQENGGKHRAINRGSQMARGELFFIVDSDDYLVVDSLSTIKEYYCQIRYDNKFAGVCGLKCYDDGIPTGGFMSQEFMDRNPLNREYKGDMAEIIRTDIIRRFQFPDFPGEKFCPEALLWYRISKDYILRYFNKNIYICEYLEDGLSNAIVRIRMQSPKYASLASQVCLSMDIPIKKKIKESINFWRFYLHIKDKQFPKIPFYSWFLLPLGFFMLIKDELTFNKDRRPQNKHTH